VGLYDEQTSYVVMSVMMGLEEQAQLDYDEGRLA
jgi:hypothetical protein